MTSLPLFQAQGGTPVAASDFTAALERVGAADCDLLFIHSGLKFGLPNPALSRAMLLGSLYEALKSLQVPTLCVPTFTFSFCNGQNFDVAASRSRMGALNEFIRQRPEAIRSADPLMSIAIVGRDRALVENPGRESVGADSAFDRISRRPRVKFLFFGELPGDCFTYMHHLEWKERVPYRYDRDFTGLVTANGETVEKTATLFVRYNGVVPNTASHTYADMLAQRGVLRSAQVGDGRISCFPEPEARETYIGLLRKEPNYFIERPFSPSQADKTFAVREMASL